MVIDTKIVAIFLLMIYAVVASTFVLKSKATNTTYTIPEGMSLQCDLVKK